MNEKEMIPIAGGYRLRTAEAGDETALLSLIRELAEYEHMQDDVSGTEGDLREWLFEKQMAEAMLIENSELRPVGYVIYFYSFSTFLGRSGIYIEDIYIKPQHRQKGIGSAVFRYFIEKKEAEGFGRLEWQVLDWNVNSIEFYEKLGAKPLPGWTQYRL